MSPLVISLSAALIGAALGLFYFGALWLTVRTISAKQHPILLTMGSLLGRLAVAVVTFVLIARWGGWIAVLAGLAGFILIRVVLVRRWGLPFQQKRVPQESEGRP
jgi:F1F0 ATPase subunit 2